MHFTPKKRLGQNFLVDKNIRNKIVDSCLLRKTDTVLEIGAGRGELTELLAQKAKTVYAVEIDDSLYKILQQKFSQDKNVKLIHKDILKVDLAGDSVMYDGKMTVLGNIPYYISTPIIEHLFRFADKIKTVFLTVQKEFADRMTALSGSREYGALSCFIQYNSKPKVIFKVPAGCFSPAPSVDSSFIKLELKKSFILSGEQEKWLFRIIRASFNKRRKTLQNALKGIVPKEKLMMFFDKYGIRKDIRPEALSLADFVKISEL